MYTVHGKVKLLCFHLKIRLKNSWIQFKYTYIFHPLSNVSILNNKFPKNATLEKKYKKIYFVGSQIRFRCFSRVLFITFWVLFGDLKFWSNVLTTISHVWFHSQLIDPPLLQLFQGPILGWWITGKLYNKAITLCSNYLCWKKHAKRWFSRKCWSEISI